MMDQPVSGIESGSSDLVQVNLNAVILASREEDACCKLVEFPLSICREVPNQKDFTSA